MSEEPVEKPTPKPKDDLTEEDRAMLKKLRELGRHAYDEGKIPATMVKLERLGMVERRKGPRAIFCLKG